MKGLRTSIRPNEIYPDKRLMGHFGTYEAERVASRIIQICQGGNQWAPISPALLRSRSGLHFEQGIARLVRDDYIDRDQDNNYLVTTEFVARCYRIAPAPASR